MPDLIAWADKAKSLLVFAIAAHNATWDTTDVLVRVGHGVGNALMLSFAAECALKALLETEDKPITKSLRIHRLHTLFMTLNPETQANASAVYEHFIASETDQRIQGPATNTLSACLESHDNAFEAWRYDVANAGTFYPVAMSYACISLLTLVDPTTSFAMVSRTSSRTEVIGGNVKTQPQQC